MLWSVEWANLILIFKNTNYNLIWETIRLQWHWVLKQKHVPLSHHSAVGILYLVGTESACNSRSGPQIIQETD